MEITGKIIQIDQTKEYGANSFQKRELVIETDEQYPQPLLVEFVQEKCAVLDQYSVGQRVKIGINLRGRRWDSPDGEAKYFNSIQGWRIQAHEEPSEETPFETVDAPKKGADDDLPF